MGEREGARRMMEEGVKNHPNSCTPANIVTKIKHTKIIHAHWLLPTNKYLWDVEDGALTILFGECTPRPAGKKCTKLGEEGENGLRWSRVEPMILR